MTGSRPSRLPLVLGLVTAVLVGGVWLLVTGPGDRSSGWTPDQGTLAGADRDALAAPPVDPGAPPGAADPGVVFTDPVAVAGAYVDAAYSLRASDAGHTNRRALPYAAPASTPGTVGVVVLSAPPPGRISAAAVTDITQVSGEPTDTRRGYLVGYRVTTGTAGATTGTDGATTADAGPDGPGPAAVGPTDAGPTAPGPTAAGPAGSGATGSGAAVTGPAGAGSATSATGGRRTRFLLLVRQFDGRWLVAGDSADAQVGEP